MLLEAYSQLPRAKLRRTRLVLAGPSGSVESFWQLVDALGVLPNVFNIEGPFREELVRQYQNAADFALPSDEEGLGVVVLEAMGCGVPVVATRSGGPDGIITDGKDGFLVSLEDASAMGSRLSTQLENTHLNVQMGQRARKTIECRYDEHIASEVFEQMWDQLLWREE